MIFIAGAGLAGLSAAFHLGGRDYRIVNRDDRPGGLCRTERTGRFAFDYGGHLLHLQGDDVRGLAADLLGGRLVSHQRKSAIYSKGVFTPYPFQVNTHGLPAETVRDCLVGFVEAMVESRDRDEPDNFRDWILAVFGKGFAEHFFMPWNEKFWKRDLSEITREWVGWSIPRPRVEDVVEGALGISDKSFGYNSEFLYPKNGIEEIALALAAELDHPVQDDTALVELVAGEKKARLSNGEEIGYDKMISTIPLDRLIMMAVDAPEEIREAARGLQVMSVMCLNIGVDAELDTDQHWIYVPEEGFRFHRIGVYSNFMETAPGTSSLYLETTVPGPVNNLVGAGIVTRMEEALDDFRGIPLWDGGDEKIEELLTLLVEHGYVVYDRHREKWLPRITEWLAGRDIHLAGRYARWEYSAMEHALRQGMEAAAACSGGAKGAGRT